MARAPGHPDLSPQMAASKNWGPFCECPYNKSPAVIWGLHKSPSVLTETPKSSTRGAQKAPDGL